MPTRGHRSTVWTSGRHVNDPLFEAEPERSMSRMDNDEKNDTQVRKWESSLKTKEKSASECPSESHAEDEQGVPLQDFPEGGWAAWATAIGACVQVSIFLVMTFLTTLEQISRPVLHVWVSYRTYSTTSATERSHSNCSFMSLTGV